MRTVARMTTTGKDISSVLRAIVKTERQHLPTWVVDSFNQYIALEPETRNSAVFNVNMAMSLWNNGLISAATETSDFDIRELRRQPMTIFIGCTIAELSIFRPLIRILFQQIHDLMMVKIPGEDEPHQDRHAPAEPRCGCAEEDASVNGHGKAGWQGHPAWVRPAGAREAEIRGS